MNGARLLAIGAFVCLAGGLSRGDDKVDYAKLIVGKWEVTKADPGTAPPGAIVEFTKDGKMKVTHKEDDKDVSFGGTYKVEGKKVSMKFKIGDDERAKTITITKISDKEMATKDEDDKVVELKRKK